MAVVEVIAVVDVVDVNVVGFIPGGRPIFRQRIYDAQPKTVVLESRVTADHHDRVVVDMKPVGAAEVHAESVFGDAVAAISAAVVPGVMFALPVVGAMNFPGFMVRDVAFAFMPFMLAILSFAYVFAMPIFTIPFLSGFLARVFTTLRGFVSLMPFRLANLVPFFVPSFVALLLPSFAALGFACLVALGRLWGR